MYRKWISSGYPLDAWPESEVGMKQAEPILLLAKDKFLTIIKIVTEIGRGLVCFKLDVTGRDLVASCNAAGSIWETAA